MGVLDPFWEEKGYITAEEYSRFCNSTVPLALLDKRYWRTGETLAADITIAHYGPQPLHDARIDWQLVYADGDVAAGGTFAASEVAIGSGAIYATIRQPLGEVRPAEKVRLVVAVTANNGQRFENDWDLWVFADEVETAWPSAVHVCARLDAEAQAALDEGRTVLMLPPPDEVDAPAVLGFSSVFWNTAWTRNQAPHTLGILCDPAHPVFAQFPTESHSNWQWWELVHGAAAMCMDHLAPDLRPLVQVIDTWFEARRLGLLYEAQVGEGRLVVCSMDLESDLDKRLVARQMRYSLAQYLAE